MNPNDIFNLATQRLQSDIQQVRAEEADDDEEPEVVLAILREVLKEQYKITV